MGPSLREFGPQIWTAEGPIAPFHGFAYSTRMAVIRLADGALFVWSPIALTAALQAEVEALGPVRFLVAPNKLHHLFLGAWKQAYPAARLYAPPGLRRRRKDLTFDADLGDAPDPAWAADVDQTPVARQLGDDRGRVLPPRQSHGDLRRPDPELCARLVHRLARRAGALGRHRRAQSERAERLAIELLRPPVGSRLAGAHSRLADRARADRPRRTGAERRPRLRPPRLRLAGRRRRPLKRGSDRQPLPPRSRAVPLPRAKRGAG